MKKLILSFALLGVCPVAIAQPAPPNVVNPAWGRVQSIAVGSKIRVTAVSAARRQTCVVASIDADGISCAQGSAAATFSRKDILKIEADHRVRNTSVGAAVGAGIGAGVEQGSSHGLGFGNGKASATVASAGLGAIVFGTIGYFTGWRTVYVAPATANP
jgi:hypothetical protein